MEAVLLPHLKKNTEVYTIQDCKIEKWFVKNIRIEIGKETSVLGKNISWAIYVDCEKYNNGVDFCERTFRLLHLFLTKEELINQLEK